MSATQEEQEMIINAKAALDYLQIHDKINRGAKGVELQLFGNCVSKENVIPQDVMEQIRKDIKDQKYRINVIHTPITSGYQSEEIEYVQSWGGIAKSAALAEHFGEIQNQSMLIVIHLTETLSNLEAYGLLPRLTQFIHELLSEYPRVHLGFENMSYCDFSSEEQMFRPRSAYYVRNGQICCSGLELVKYLHNERCGVVLDTCHIMMTQNFLNDMSAFFHTPFDKINVMEKLFQQCSPYLKLVHLNNAQGHGYGQMHGLPFLPNKAEDMERLAQIWHYYTLYGNQCPITIEVMENDYRKSENWSATYQALQYYMHM